MQHIKFTQVDAVTGVSVAAAPARNGPKMPAITGLEFAFARESAYPTSVPHFFGTVPDDANTQAPGVLAVLTPEDFAQAMADELEARKAKARTSVNADRDRREISGFPYLGKTIDSDPTSVQRITVAVQAAQAAMAVGQPFEVDWMCADNTELPLDAVGMISMPVALAAYAQALHQHGRVLKGQISAATDFASLAAVNLGAGWPA